MSQRCKGTVREGGQCTRAVPDGTELCPWHDPRTAKRIKEKLSLGVKGSWRSKRRKKAIQGKRHRRSPECRGHSVKDGTPCRAGTRDEDQLCFRHKEQIGLALCDSPGCPKLVLEGQQWCPRHSAVVLEAAIAQGRQGEVLDLDSARDAEVAAMMGTAKCMVRGCQEIRPEGVSPYCEHHTRVAEGRFEEHKVPKAAAVGARSETLRLIFEFGDEERLVFELGSLTLNITLESSHGVSLLEGVSDQVLQKCITSARYARAVLFEGR